jgi:hypothetical protein
LSRFGGNLCTSFLHKERGLISAAWVLSNNLEICTRRLLCRSNERLGLGAGGLPKAPNRCRVRPVRRPIRQIWAPRLRQTPLQKIHALQRRSAMTRLPAILIILSLSAFNGANAADYRRAPVSGPYVLLTTALKGGSWVGCDSSIFNRWDMSNDGQVGLYRNSVGNSLLLENLLDNLVYPITKDSTCLIYNSYSTSYPEPTDYKLMAQAWDAPTTCQFGDNNGAFRIELTGSSKVMKFTSLKNGDDPDLYLVVGTAPPQEPCKPHHCPKLYGVLHWFIIAQKNGVYTTCRPSFHRSSRSLLN